MFHAVPPLAFGWLDPPMLGWMAAAAAPLLLHLWRRRDYRETPWAAADLLHRALGRQSRRLRVRRWLLLLVRIALILLLAAAMARPYWSQSATASAGGRTHHLLMLDDSYSMSYRGQGTSPFEQAKETARRIVGQSATGDAFTLAAMSAPPRVILGPMTDAAAILRRIEELAVSQTVADLPAATDLAKKLLDAPGDGRGEFARCKVFFLSDMQQTTWSPRLSEVARTEFLRSSKQLAAAASIEVVEVGQAGGDNTAVVKLHADNPPAHVGREMTLRAELGNFGEKPVRRLPVELWIDGRREDVVPVDIGPGKTAAAEFRRRFDAPGDRAVEVRADGDGLTFDNRRYLALPVGRAVRVLCIDGRPTAERLRGAADFVALALASGEPGSRQPAMQAVVAAEAEMLQRDWSEFDCLIFCDVVQFTAAEARRIEDFLLGGGGVVFILGERARAERYNAELGPTGQGRAGRRAILPADIGQLSEQSLRIDPLGCRHPLLAAFREKGRAGLSAAIVLKHFSLQLPEATVHGPAGDWSIFRQKNEFGVKTQSENMDLSPSRGAPAVVLALENGEPLLVERAFGAGRVALLAAAAEPSWTTLPLGPAFLPLIREVVLYCAAGRGQTRRATVGQPLKIILPPKAAAENPQIELPSGRVRPLRPAAAEFEFADTETAGFYVLKYGPSLDNKMLFAVNVEAGEGDLRRISPPELRERTWPDLAFDVRSERGGNDTVSPIPSTDCSSPSVALLYVVLGLLLVDLFMSRSHRSMP